MAKQIIGPEIEQLVKLLARLPGLGPRSARKAALALIKKRDTMLVPLGAAINTAIERIVVCPACGNVDTIAPCSICRDENRDQSVLVVVEDVGDLWALERAGVLNARYHVLGGHISPLDGVGPEQLNMASLVDRSNAPGVKEVILALNATVEGQSTAHYIMELLQGCDVATTRLAQGVPIGGELDYLDEGTLAAAIKSRK